MARALLIVALAVFAVFVLAGCGGDDHGSADARGADAPPPDAPLPDYSYHCDSAYYWCEDGTIYRGFPDYYTSGCYGGDTCGVTAQDWQWLQELGTCPAGCATSDAGSGCIYCDYWAKCPIGEASAAQLCN